MAVDSLDVVVDWPDAEDVVKAILRVVEVDTGSGMRRIERVGRETKAGEDLAGGTVRIERIGGAPDRDDLADSPLVELAMFGADVAQVKAIRSAVGMAMKATVGETVDLGDGRSLCLDVARIEAGPLRPPWSSETGTQRRIENWRLSWRPASAS